MQNPIKPPQCTYSHEKKKKIGWLCNIEFKRLYVIIFSSDIDKYFEIILQIVESNYQESILAQK